MAPPLKSIIASAARAVRKYGVFGALRNVKNSKHLRAGFWDGGLLVALLKVDGAVLKGVDSVGNKYWERMQDQHGRHRWVEYADAVDYDAASVPPEWHGWLHHITDHTPEQLEALKPTRYGLEAWDRAPKHMAKGYALHPQRRSWKHFEPWQALETETAPVAAIESFNDPAPKMAVPEPPACWDASLKVIPGLGEIGKDRPKEPEKVCWDGTVKVISGLGKIGDKPRVEPEKVCWDGTVNVVSGLGKVGDKPPIEPEKVCWDDTVKVISGLGKVGDQPPIIKVVPGSGKTGKDPP